ncbi:MAG: response regulator transcription factor [Woeseia sp.]
MAKVLLVEDDSRISQFIKRGLEAEGYVVDLAVEGGQALSLARDHDYELIVLDRMLPGRDGMEICRLLRVEKNEALILMLTAMDTLQNKIDGLRCGADDYMTKPFAFDELLARMEALKRRGGKPAADPVLQIGDLTLDSDAKKAWRGDREITLTAREYALLSYLMHNAGTVVSRNRLLNNVWGMDFDPGTKVVDVYISYLRRKIDEDGEPPMIKTVRGFGYILAEPE